MSHSPSAKKPGAASKKSYAVQVTQLSGNNIVAGGEDYYLYATVCLGGRTFHTPLASRPIPSGGGGDSGDDRAAGKAAASSLAGPSSPSSSSAGFTVDAPNPTWQGLLESGNRIVFYGSGSGGAMPDAEFTVRGKPRKWVDEQRMAMRAKTEAIAKLLESSSSSSSSSRGSNEEEEQSAMMQQEGLPTASRRRRKGAHVNSMAAQLLSKTEDPFAVQAATPSSSDPFFGYARVRLDEAMLKKNTPVRLGIRGPKDESLLRLHGTLGRLVFTIDYVDEGALEPVVTRDDAIGDEGNSDDGDEEDLSVEAYLAAERRALEKALSPLSQPGDGPGASGDGLTAATAAVDHMKVCCVLKDATFFPLDPVFTAASLNQYRDERRSKAEAKLARRREKLEKLERLDANTKTEWWKRQRAQDKARRAKEAEKLKDAETVEGLANGCGSLGRLLTVDATFLSLQLRSSAATSSPQHHAQGEESGPSRSSRSKRMKKEWQRSSVAACPQTRGADPTKKVSFREQQAFRREYMNQVLQSVARRQPPSPPDRHALELARSGAFQWVGVDALLEEGDLLQFQAIVGQALVPDSGPSADVLAQCPSEMLCVAKGPLYLSRRTGEQGAVTLEAIVPCYVPGEERRSDGEHGDVGAEAMDSAAAAAAAAPELSGTFSGEMSGGDLLRTIKQVQAELQQQRPRCSGKPEDGEKGSDTCSANPNAGTHDGHEDSQGLQFSFTGTAAPAGLDETMFDRTALNSTMAPLRLPAGAHENPLPCSTSGSFVRRGGARGGRRRSLAQHGTPCGWLVLTLKPESASFDVDTYLSKAQRFVPESDATLAPPTLGPSARSGNHPPRRASLIDSTFPDDNIGSAAPAFAGKVVTALSPTTPVPAVKEKGAAAADEADNPDVPVELPNAPPGGFVVSPVAVELASRSHGGSARYTVVGLREVRASEAGRAGGVDKEEELFATPPGSAVDGLVKLPTCVYVVESCGPALAPLMFDVYEADASGARLRCAGRCSFDYGQLPFVGRQTFALKPRRGDGPPPPPQRANDGPINVTLQWNISPEAQQGFLLQLLKTPRVHEQYGLPSVAEINAAASPAELRRKQKARGSDGSETDTGSASGQGSGMNLPLQPRGAAIARDDAAVLPPSLPQRRERPVTPPFPSSLPPPLPLPPPSSAAGAGRTPTSPQQPRPPTLEPQPPPPRRHHHRKTLKPAAAVPVPTRPLSLSGHQDSNEHSDEDLTTRHVSRGHTRVDSDLTLHVTVLSAMNLRLPSRSAENGCIADGTFALSPSLTIAPYVVLRYEGEREDNYSVNLPVVRVQSALKAPPHNDSSAPPSPPGVVTWNFSVAFTVPRALAGQPYQLLTFEVRDGNTRQVFGTGTLSLATPGVELRPVRQGVHGEGSDDGDSHTSSSSASAAAARAGKTQAHVVPIYQRRTTAADGLTVSSEPGLFPNAVAAVRERLHEQSDSDDSRHGSGDGEGRSDWLLESVAPCVGELTVLASVAPKRSLLAELFDSSRGHRGGFSVMLSLSVVGGVELRTPLHLPAPALRPYVVVSVEQRQGQSLPQSERQSRGKEERGPPAMRRRQRQYRSATAPSFAGTHPLWYMELPPLIMRSLDDSLTFTVFHAEGEGFDVVLGEARLTTRELVERALATVASSGSGATRSGNKERHCTPPQLVRLPLSVNALSREDSRSTFAGFLTVEWFMQRFNEEEVADGQQHAPLEEASDPADYVPHVLELGMVQAQGVALPAEAIAMVPSLENMDVVALLTTEGAGERTADCLSLSSQQSVMVGQLQPRLGAGDDIEVCFSPLNSTVPLRLPSRLEPVKIELYLRVFHDGTLSENAVKAIADVPLEGSGGDGAAQGPCAPFTVHFLGEAALQVAALDVCAVAQEPRPLTLGLRPRRDPRYRSKDVLRANQSCSNRSSGGGLGGLGFLTVRAALYTLGAFDARVRQQLQQQGLGYTVQVQVRDTADFAHDGVYVVEVRSLGTAESHRTPPVRGLNPNFQQQSFLLSLQRPTEPLEFRLLCRSESPRSSSSASRSFFLVAATTLTITGPDYQSPPQPPASSPLHVVQSAWLTLVPVDGENPWRGAGPNPKLFVRWRVVQVDGANGNVAFPATAPALLANVYGVPRGVSQSTGNAAVHRYILPPSGIASLYDVDSASSAVPSAQRIQTQVEPPFSSRVEELPSRPSSVAGTPSPTRHAQAVHQDSSPLPPPEPFTLAALYGPTGQLVHFTGSAQSSTAQDVMLYCRVVAEGGGVGEGPDEGHQQSQTTPARRMALYAATGSDGELQQLPFFQPLSQYVKSGAYVQVLEVGDGSLVVSRPGAQRRPHSAGLPPGASAPSIAASSAAKTVSRSGRSPSQHTLIANNRQSYQLDPVNGLMSSPESGLLGEEPRCVPWLRSRTALQRANRAVLDELARRTVVAMTAAEDADSDRGGGDPSLPSTTPLAVATCVLTLPFATIRSADVQAVLQQVSGGMGAVGQRQLRGLCRPCSLSLPEPNATRMAMGHSPGEPEKAPVATFTAPSAALPGQGARATRVVEGVAFVLQASPALLYAFLSGVTGHDGRPLLTLTHSDDDSKSGEGVTAILELVVGVVPLLRKHTHDSLAKWRLGSGAFPLAATAADGRQLLLSCIQRHADGPSGNRGERAAPCLYEDGAALGGEGVYFIDGTAL